MGDPVLTGISFNDAYRYMDWLLTLPEDEATTKCWTLGSKAAIMIAIGYPGELIVEGNLWVRWLFWALALVPFCSIVQELLVGLAGATNAEPNDTVRALIFRSQWVTVRLLRLRH